MCPAVDSRSDGPSHLPCFGLTRIGGLYLMSPAVESQSDGLSHLRCCGHTHTESGSLSHLTSCRAHIGDLQAS